MPERALLTALGIDVRLPAPTPPPSLSVAVDGPGRVTGSPGGISCPGFCQTAQPAGTVVTLTPSAEPGAVFAGWDGDCSGIGACAVTLTGPNEVLARFAPAPPGTGTGTGGGASTGDVTPPPPATVLPLAAAPSPVVPTVPGGSAVAALPRPVCSIGTPSRVKAGRFTVALRCDRSARLALSGTVAFPSGKRTTRLRLRSSGRTARRATVALTLPAAAVRALRQKRRVTASLALAATTSAGAASVRTGAKRLAAARSRRRSSNSEQSACGGP